jgi:hypothetical protein
MLAPSETIAARGVLFAVEDFMQAAKTVTRRSLHKGTSLDSVRYQIRKKEFARSKDVLMNAIDQINSDSELGRNIERLFRTPGFAEIIERELSNLQVGYKSAEPPDNADAVKMSGLGSEGTIFEFEAKVLQRLNLSSAWISKLIYSHGVNGHD